MLKGYCDVCNKWVTQGTLIPCVDLKYSDLPPSTCGLLKDHQVVDAEVVKSVSVSFEQHRAAVWSESAPQADLFDSTEWGPQTSTKVKSDGGSTSYYDLPKDASELNDLIEHKDMPFARGNIFKACYRLGEKDNTDALYDINKIIFFAERMKGALLKGQKV